MQVGFIGAGKVGTAMGCYFCRKGIQVAGYYSRSLSSAKMAASRTGSRAYNNMEELAGSVDLIALTVPDDEIEAVGLTLAEMHLCWEQKIALHMSGVHSSDILAPLGEKGATLCSIHPMLSFGNVDASVEALPSAVFTVEGRGVKLDVVKEMIEICGNRWVEISTKDKVLYHAAACVMSNYMVTLLDAGLEMLNGVGFSPENAVKLITPLVEKTLVNVINIGAEEALTGPISRGDAGTVEKHMGKLREQNGKWLRLYKVLGLYTTELAKRAGKIDEMSAIKIKEVLGKYE